MVIETKHDPVCHMDIDPATAAGISEYEGTTYYFCSRGCKVDFDADPAGVLKAEAAYDHSQPMDHGMMASSTPSSAKKPWWKFW
ncbi:MAG TPA: YHS domain-containing protein [Dehalococcoidia bacterium]|nr:YHS domain-containing protein [Dehalococcoidia bacterium]